MSRPFLILLASHTVWLWQTGQLQSDDDFPNIILILADDFGRQDLGCYGSELFETPQLDRLAAEGMRFEHAYAPAPICSASRASILTGKSPARLGFEFVTKNEAGYQPVHARLRAPPFTLDLPLVERTIAEVLGDAGYRTAFFGKWHLNRHHGGYLGWSPTHGPQAQGFDVAMQDFGSHPYSYWTRKSERESVDIPEDTFPADSMNERAMAFLRESHEQPFFLMVSHFFVHTPVHTRVGWLYEQSLSRIPADHPRREALAHYGAMVATLDHLVGELLRSLEEEELTDSTLVVFTSDNGGHPEYAGNAPLRGSKWNLYEGGIRVPFMVRWPGNVEPGTLSSAVVTGTDLLPTFVDVAEESLPSKLDGTSIMPFFLDPIAEDTSRELIWHFPYYHPERGFAEAPSDIGIDDGVTSQTRPHSAIRQGSWKLLHFYEDGRDELYHLSSDASEQKDLSQSRPQAAARLRAALDRRLEDQQARFPDANPNWSRP